MSMLALVSERLVDLFVRELQLRSHSEIPENFSLAPAPYRRLKLDHRLPAFHIRSKCASTFAAAPAWRIEPNVAGKVGDWQTRDAGADQSDPNRNAASFRSVQSIENRAIGERVGGELDRAFGAGD